MLRPLTSGIFFIAAATAAAAEPTQLTSLALSETVAGSVIALDTPIGTTIPMRFGTDGLVSGEAGILASFLGSAKDRGRWWVANDRLCIKWFRWFESQPRCMEIRVDGTRVFWRKDDGDSGTATLTEATKSVAGARSAPQGAAAKPIEQQIEQQVAVNSIPDKAPPQPVLAGVASPSVAPVKMMEESLATAPASSPPKAPASPEPGRAGPRPQSRHKAPPPQTASLARKAVPVEAFDSFRVAGVDEDDMLNVRNGPSEYHKAIGIISARGRGVKIVGKCHDDWCPVRHGGVTGWVNRFYLAQESANHGAPSGASERKR